jgi:hypothetical protein
MSAAVARMYRATNNKINRRLLAQRCLSSIVLPKSVQHKALNGLCG